MKIFKATVSELLWEMLCKVMTFKELESFRLVGGTSLSLLLGHRMSVDIDLFTDAEYGSIDFDKIDVLFLNSFKHVEMSYGGNNGMGKTYFIGKDKENLIKVDLFYTDPFIYPFLNYGKLRLTRSEEISAMKLEVVGNSGRKKDFWDIHELMNYFTLKEILAFYLKRHPYSYTADEIIFKMTDFEEADSDFDPICLKNKYWELIKLDIEEAVASSFY
ncbi:Nucleotidyl transferase AbiEii toxin, Type IV TA system [Salegentibacter echinorum]|uniref:Nucleotidyl transferase AbiEii toxin, Type IV TA system n=1 Tax=Salegentibacter echinorum TaxID=1073325 RepID=A0A1M5BVL7_SALEC|nr:nucleotidyl transferase AbiEii/AbiGii toxin family protein [Salegentibacter echinorum]SHF46569.1 Nucleotidyl transferase AbiEii toxin, Type IV TA system [Salegentibacter echinorum]